MVKFKTKITENKKHHQKTINIPSFVFKQDLLEYDENAEYEVDINKINSEKLESKKE